MQANNSFVTNTTGPFLAAVQQIDPFKKMRGFPIPAESVVNVFQTPDGRIHMTHASRFDTKRQQWNDEVAAPCGKVETDGKDYSDEKFVQTNANGEKTLRETEGFETEALTEAAKRELAEECSGSKDPLILKNFIAAVGEERLEKLYAESTKMYLVSDKDNILTGKKYNTLVTVFVLHVTESFIAELNEIILRYPEREHKSFFGCDWKIETKEETKNGQTKMVTSLVLVSENNDKWPQKNGELVKVRNFFNILFRVYWQQFQTALQTRSSQ